MTSLQFKYTPPAKADGTMPHVVDQFLFHPKSRMNLEAYNLLIVSDLCAPAYGICKASDTQKTKIRIAGFASLEETHNIEMDTLYNRVQVFRYDAVLLCSEFGEHLGMLRISEVKTSVVHNTTAAVVDNTTTTEYEVCTYAHAVGGITPCHALAHNRIELKAVFKSLSITTKAQYDHYFRLELDQMKCESIRSMTDSEHSLLKTTDYKAFCRQSATAKIMNALNNQLIRYRSDIMGMADRVNTAKYTAIKYEQGTGSVSTSPFTGLASGNIIAVLDCIFGGKPADVTLDPSTLHGLEQLHKNLRARLDKCEDNLKQLIQFYQQPKYVISVNSNGFTVQRIPSRVYAGLNGNLYDRFNKVSDYIQHIINDYKAYFREQVRYGVGIAHYYDLHDMPTDMRDELLGVLSPFKMYVENNLGDESNSAWVNPKDPGKNIPNYYFTDQRGYVPAWDSMWYKDIVAASYGPSANADHRYPRVFTISIP